MAAKVEAVGVSADHASKDVHRDETTLWTCSALATANSKKCPVAGHEGVAGMPGNPDQNCLEALGGPDTNSNVRPSPSEGDALSS